MLRQLMKSSQKQNLRPWCSMQVRVMKYAAVTLPLTFAKSVQSPDVFPTGQVEESNDML